MRLVITRTAEADIGNAYCWYEEQRVGLGPEFLAEINSAFEAVLYEPLRFQQVHRFVRRALVHRFPYGVFFVVAAREITVIAVMHLARNPRRMYQRGVPKQG